MEKVVWETLVVPGLRERLIRKYVPVEPTDPLVYKVTSFYWLMQELIGNWKSGKRLALEQKAQLLQLLVWNLTRLEQEQTAYDEGESEYKIRRQGFDYPRETVPRDVDVALCETSDEDTSISSETTEQIAQLVLACKEFKLKVPRESSL
jgi:uncharacterized protein YeaC (DUF1315 family)